MGGLPDRRGDCLLPARGRASHVLRGERDYRRHDAAAPQRPRRKRNARGPHKRTKRRRARRVRRRRLGKNRVLLHRRPFRNGLFVVRIAREQAPLSRKAIQEPLCLRV